MQKRHRKLKHIFIHKCDWCNREIILNGQNSDPFVVNAERKYFCIEQTPGKPAERDCMSDYLEDKKNKYELSIKKKLEEKKEQEETKEKEKEKKLEERPRVLAKIASYEKELKQRQAEERLYKNLHKWSTT